MFQETRSIPLQRVWFQLCILREEHNIESSQSNAKSSNPTLNAKLFACLLWDRIEICNKAKETEFTHTCVLHDRSIHCYQLPMIQA